MVGAHRGPYDANILIQTQNNKSNILTVNHWFFNFDNW